MATDAERCAAEEAALLVSQLLLDGGAEVNGRSHKLNTPLHVACARVVPLPLLQLLLERTADIDALNVRRESPLHLLSMSATFDSTQAACLLVQKGASLSLVDRRRESATHKAIASGNLSLACELVRAGASLTARSAAGFPP